MADFKSTKKKLIAIKDKSKKSIKKLGNALSLDLTDTLNQPQQTENKKNNLEKNNEINIEKNEENVNWVNPVAKSKDLQNNDKSIISKHRAAQNKIEKNEGNVNWVNPVAKSKGLQNNDKSIISKHRAAQNKHEVEKIEPQQAISINEVKRQQVSEAPANASTTLPSEPPQPKFAQEDIEIKARQLMGIDTTTTYFSPAQHLITTIPKVEPQQAISISEVKKPPMQSGSVGSRQLMGIDTTTTYFSPAQHLITTIPKVEPQQAISISEVKKPPMQAKLIKANEYHVEVDNNTSYFSPAQHVIITTPKVEPKQATFISDVKRPRHNVRKAPSIASEVLPLKPPQLRSIKEDMEIKTKRQMGIDTTTTYSSPARHLITTIPKVEPQQAISINEVKRQQARKAPASTSEGLKKFDELIDNFSKGEGAFKSSNTTDKKSQITSKVNQAKKLITPSDQEAKISKPLLGDKKLYENMYESLAPSEKAQTTKSMFMQNAINHQINKIVRSMQAIKAKDNDSISPSNSPKNISTTINKNKNEGFKI